MRDIKLKVKRYNPDREFLQITDMEQGRDYKEVKDNVVTEYLVTMSYSECFVGLVKGC